MFLLVFLVVLYLGFCDTLKSISFENEMEISEEVPSLEVPSVEVPSLDLRQVHVLESIFNTTKPILLFLYNDDDITSSSFKLKYEYYISLLVPLQVRWKEVLTFYLCPKSTCVPAVLSVFYLKLKNIPRAVIHDVKRDLKFVQPPNGHIPPVGAGNAHISMKTLEEFIFNSICQQDDSDIVHEDIGKEFIEMLENVCHSLPTMEFSEEDERPDLIDVSDNDAGYYSKDKIRASRKRLKIDIYSNYYDENEDIGKVDENLVESTNESTRNVETPDEVESRSDLDNGNALTVDSSSADSEVVTSNDNRIEDAVDTEEVTSSNTFDEDKQQHQDESRDEAPPHVDEHGRVFLSSKELDEMLQGLIM